MFTLRSAVNLSSMSTHSNNCVTAYKPQFHVNAYEHSFAICVAYYWNVHLHLFSDHLNNFDFSVFMRGRSVKRL